MIWRFTWAADLRACLLASSVLGLAVACGPLVTQARSETEANAEVRAALRADPAFQLIPPEARASQVETTPEALTWSGYQTGLNGVGGTEPAPPGIDSQSVLMEWDGKLRKEGWTPAGGLCDQPTEPALRRVSGVWSKQIRGRPAFFKVSIVGSRLEYGMYIRAVSDSGPRDMMSLLNFFPGPIGCSGPQMGVTASPPPPSTRATPPQASLRLPACDPAAGDYQKQGRPTPAPCISIDPYQQIRDNLRHLERMTPKPVDVAFLQPAAADLNRALQDLRAQGLYDDVSVRQAIAGYKSLDGALVHPPHNNEKWSTRDARAVVVLAHASACLIGEHGPTTSVVNVVGHTNDGGCEALYGH